MFFSSSILPVRTWTWKKDKGKRLNRKYLKIKVSIALLFQLVFRTARHPPVFGKVLTTMWTFFGRLVGSHLRERPSSWSDSWSKESRNRTEKKIKTLPCKKLVICNYWVAKTPKVPSRNMSVNVSIKYKWNYKLPIGFSAVALWRSDLKVATRRS